MTVNTSISSPAQSSAVGSDVVTAFDSADGSLGSAATSPNFATVFGGVGDGTTNNDAAFDAAEADTNCNSVWLPRGVFVTTKSYSALKKHYWGQGQIKTGESYTLPGRFNYANELPAGHLGQGGSSWFDGDQKFGDPEWHIIGPDTRTYVRDQRYFQSQLTPRNSWLDAHSGNSGGQAFMPNGATAGSTTIQLHAPPIPEWVGKQVGFSQVCNIGGDPTLHALEWHVITAINQAAKTITIDAPLQNTYTWDPATGRACHIGFSNRTMNTQGYVKVTSHSGAGGDSYGSVVRMAHNYVPKPSETHVLMAATAGQYGGDVTFGADGTLCTGWESQYVDQGHSVAAIGQVDSFNRTNDDCPAGSGRQWLGMRLQSAGSRPIESAIVWAGRARTGLDLAQGVFTDSAKLAVAASAGATTLSVDSTNGAVAGDGIAIGSYNGVIQSVGVSSVTISPALTGAYPAGTIVDYTQGGSAINMAFGQKIVFNTSTSSVNRGGDPLGAFGPLWSNKRGDIQMETANDGISDYWAVRYNGTGHSGATARIRLRPTQFQINCETNVGNRLSASQGLITNGNYDKGNSNPTIYLGNSTGTGNYIWYNVSNNTIQIVKNNVVVAQW